MIIYIVCLGLSIVLGQNMAILVCYHNVPNVKNVHCIIRCI
jgi:hypothetical protein